MSLTAPVGRHDRRGTHDAGAPPRRTSSGGVTQVQFTVDGTQGRRCAPDRRSEPFSIAWLTSDFSNGGAHADGGRADVAGNETVSIPADGDRPQRPARTRPTRCRPRRRRGRSRADADAARPRAPGPAPEHRPPTDPAPALSRLKLSRARFRKGRSTTISFRLSEAAKVSAVLRAQAAGRRTVRGRCVKPAKHARAELHSLCARARGELTLRGKAGTNSCQLPRQLAQALAGDRGATGSRCWRRIPPASARPPARASFTLLSSASRSGCAGRASGRARLVLGCAHGNAPLQLVRRRRGARPRARAAVRARLAVRRAHRAARRARHVLHAAGRRRAAGGRARPRGRAARVRERLPPPRRRGRVRRGRCTTLQCHYHAWTYGLDGALRAARAADADFDRDELGLRRAQVDTWGPFVFVNADARRAAARRHARRAAASWCATAGSTWTRSRFHSRAPYTLEANWKVAVENFLECYHCAVAHPGLQRGGRRVARRLPAGAPRDVRQPPRAPARRQAGRAASST